MFMRLLAPIVPSKGRRCHHQVNGSCMENRIARRRRRNQLAAASRRKNRGK